MRYYQLTYLLALLILPSLCFSQGLDFKIALAAGGVGYKYDVDDQYMPGGTLGWSAGVLLFNDIGFISRNLLLRAGIDFSSKSYEGEIESTKLSIPEYYKKSFIYRDYQLGFGYQLHSLQPFKPYIVPGIRLRRVLYRENRTIFPDGRIEDGFNISIDENRNSHHFSLVLGLEYRYTEKLSLGFEAFYLTELNESAINNYDAESEWGAGFHLLICYRINTRNSKKQDIL